jgi:hypothetical protein
MGASNCEGRDLFCSGGRVDAHDIGPKRVSM